jgi:hypothetical protein
MVRERTDALDKGYGDVFGTLLCIARAADPFDDLSRKRSSPRRGVDDGNAPHDVTGGDRRLSLSHPADGSMSPPEDLASEFEECLRHRVTSPRRRQCEADSVTGWICICRVVPSW